MTLPADLLDKLACPRCRGPLNHDETANELSCSACDVSYEVRDGIPDLVPAHARPREAPRPEPPDGRAAHSPERA